jgi:arginase
MPRTLALVGAPSSAGAYAPGQEKAPAALRDAGLVRLLEERGHTVLDRGDVASFRWRADHANPRAMNAEAVARTAVAVGDGVASALGGGSAVLVIGGDCTVELGTVAGALRGSHRVGLIYIDLDTDLNTPESTTDGALDWMGVAHMLGLEGTVPALANLGPHAPLLHPDQLLYFAHDNVEPFERRVLEDLRIAQVPIGDVSPDPATAAQRVVSGWAKRYERLLIHVDVDVLDYLYMPLAENCRRNVGLKFSELMASLRVFLGAPNWSALTICELNPDHGQSDGATLRTFATALAEALD